MCKKQVIYLNRLFNCGVNMVKTENLVFKYSRYNQETEQKEYVEALSGVDIEINGGEFVAVLGHNGSGKSTLAKHINVLLLPSGGKVYVNGLDTAVEDNVWVIRQNAGMVFQNPDNQLVATIVEEDIAFGPENLGVPPLEIRERVDSCLKAVDMEEFKRSAPNLLSGGQKQRIAIAGVLAMKPRCIVLDEATAMLDPIGRREVMNIIRRLNKEEGITVVHITHYMEEAVLADRVIVMSGGKAVMDNTPKHVFKNVEFLKENGLDVPQVTELSNMLRKSGANLADDIISLSEMADALEALRKTSEFEAEEAAISQFDRDIEKPLDVPSYIEIEGLSHIYSPGTVFEKAAVENINLNIKKGEFFGIIGHTGSGKSTLIQHLNALMKPTSGHILIDGEDINADKTRLKAIRQKVGLIFQYPENQLFEATVFEDVAFGPKNIGLDEHEIERRVKNALELVGLSEEYYKKSPFELSGGQKRRVAIAGVLAMEPEILVMDEPTAGLDPRGRDEIFGQIKNLHSKMGNTVIIVSHSMEDIARLTDRLAVIAKGEIRFLGTPKEVFKNIEELESIGLAAPQISYLIRMLRERGFNISEDIYTVEDAFKALKQIII